MYIRRVCIAILLLAALFSLSFQFSIQQPARTTIIIQPDGSINPAAPIQRNGDTYTFTGDAYDPIFVQKSNITIDGAGYSLIGPLNETQKQSEQILGIGPNATIDVPYIIGVDFDKTVNGVTVKNLNVNWFNIGIYIRTTNNTVINNGVTDNIVGILLSGSANNITLNYIRDNRQGLFFGFEQVNGSSFNIPSDIKVSENSFLYNEMQLSGCVCKVYNFTEARHAWDYDNRGNYWSDYNGTDANGDGIGDTYYIIDPLNYDRYPFIQIQSQPPAPAAQYPAEIVVPIVAVIAIVIIVILFFVIRRKRNFK